MHRRPLLDMLELYRRVCPGEDDMVDRIVELIRAHADCFDRTCRPGHITGSAWIVSADRCRVLLTHHRKLNRWLQLGGHADGDPRAEQVALREAREESGVRGFDFVTDGGPVVPLDVDVHEIPARHDADGRVVEDAHEHHDIRFLLVAHAGQEVRASDESHDVGWFTPDEVRELTDEVSVLRMLEKALRLLG